MAPVLCCELSTHLDLQLHDVATGGSTHEARANARVALVHAAHVAGLLVVVHHVLMVAPDRAWAAQAQHCSGCRSAEQGKPGTGLLDCCSRQHGAGTRDVCVVE